MDRRRFLPPTAGLAALGLLAWRVPVAIFASVAALSALLHAVLPADGAYHCPDALSMLFSGGLTLGAVYMATDPVTSPFTNRGKWIYGIMIGAMVVLIRTVNPAYPLSLIHI